VNSALKRAFRREREAAKILGSRRIHRAYGLSAPDLEPIQLASGETIVAEVKTRKRLPALLVGALEQARRYAPDAIPMAVVSEYGGQAMAAMMLVDLARLLGINATPAPARKRRCQVRQLQLAWCA
jgi:hypothetical protein